MGPVPVLIAAHVCSMLGFASYAALLPELRNAWALTNAQAGIVSGMFFGGYVASVSYWTAATDRVDGRKMFIAGLLLDGETVLAEANALFVKLKPGQP